MVLRAAVLLQLVHLGIQLLGTQCHYQYGLSYVRYYEHTLEDMATYHMWAPMRRMAVGGMHHIFELWENMEKFNCDMVAMYDQLQCKGMQGVHGLFEDEFRKRNVNAFWIPHALPDSRTVSRMEIRRMINDYMTTVMHEEPLDPSLLDFDDSMTW